MKGTDDLHKAGGNVAATSRNSFNPLPESSKTRWSWSVKPDSIWEDQISETINCEVLVLGFGSGGAPAALYAASHGADTVVMTKNGVVEANGGRVGLWNSKHDADYGITYHPLHWRRLIARYTNGRGNPKVFGSLVDHSGEAIQRTQVYYAHPYSAWERGSNENANKLIRRFIPKGADIAEFSLGRIKMIENWINNYPRRIFNGLSANDLLKKQNVA